MIFKLEYCGVNIIENAPFKIDRPEGSYRYIFFHFISQVILEIDGKLITASPGTCILYSPKVSQKFYVENNRLNHDYIDFILLENDFFKKINFPLNIPFNPRDSQYINNAIKQIYTEKNSVEIGNTYKCEAQMLDLFINLTRKFHYRKSYNTEKYSDTQKTKFEELRLNIYQKPDSLKVAILAKKMGFSLSRFNELYKSYFNTTPIKDLTESRVKRVEELLKDGCSTKEIIKRIGFSSDEYFYRWFKKHFNMTKENYYKNLIEQEK